MRCSLGNVLYLVGVRHDGSNPDFSENGENLPVKRFSASLFFDVWNRVCRIIREIDQSFFLKPWRRGGLIRYSLSYCNYVLLGGLKPDRCCIKNNPVVFPICYLCTLWRIYTSHCELSTANSFFCHAVRSTQDAPGEELRAIPQVTPTPTPVLNQ